MIVAFDFDGVITDIRIQRLVRKLRKENNEVWIVTATRDNGYNKKIVQPVLDRIGLSEYQVIYVDEKPKWEYLKGINADLYIDNIPKELEIINNCTSTIALLWS